LLEKNGQRESLMRARILNLVGSRRVWGVALGVPVAGLVALSTVASVSLLPPSVKRKPLAYSLATTQLYVMPHAGLGNATENDDPLQYVAREMMLANQIASPELRRMIADDAGLDPKLVAVDGPVAIDLPVAQQEPSGPKRSNQEVVEGDLYRVKIDENSALPTIGVTAQAPSAGEAVRLANAVETAVSTYLTGLEASANTPTALRLEVRPLAPVAVSGDGTGGLKNVAGLAFLVALTLWVGVVYAVTAVVRDVRRLRGSWEAGTEVHGGTGR